MTKTLIVAEKPSVARDIASVIIKGPSSSKTGYIEGKKYIITWAIGHLVTLCEPDHYDEKYKKWNMVDLPIIPEEFILKPSSKTKKQFDIVKKLMNSKEVEGIICATDSGREGELIFRYIYQLANCNTTFKRLWISSMTEEAIKKGFDELKDGTEYDALYQSARCRSEADWLIGMNGTRAYTIKNNILFSIGRVQTPTLAMIVNRDMEIKNFKPQDYWEVKSIYDNFQGLWTDIKENSSKISSEENAKTIANKVKGSTGEVIDIKKEKKSQPAPLLYDLTELQRDGNKYFGYTAKETLNIAQSLYEKHKLITYPRTDSRYLSKDMKSIVKETLEKLRINPYEQYISKIIDKLKFTSRIINDKKITDHHACIPTPKTPNIQRLNIKEKNIYNLIVKRLITVFFPRYKYETTTIVVENQGEDFVSKGKVVTDWGWKLIYMNDEKKEKDSEQQLPSLKKGENLLFKDTEIIKKQTKPPKQYTESTLLSAMENAGRLIDSEELREQLKGSGLGTPATRASIIERIIQVGYIKREKKSLVPTVKGISIISTIPNELKSPELTGKWEKALNNIAKDKFSPERFMESINNFATFIVTEAGKSRTIEIEGDMATSFKRKRRGKATRQRPVIGVCPLCKKGNITQNSKGYGCSEYVNSCKFFIGAFIAGKKLNKTEVKDLVEKGETSVIQGFSYKNGGTFEAKLVIENGKVVFGKR
ncbi:DNA topoisomerase III [Clostridium sp. D2Q-11]|uniref:DNA topoisomerase n=1 Tax=Anaeromonas frigoriresistens TaxID=2683708 RepID=A0A942USX2_9FIRM|nr:DNA topoisomerase III [Anaeromonas frigoriresistens]MBS4537360.1 DNA topoisomerase III [Anaeromonas frigoriresistens]